MSKVYVLVSQGVEIFRTSDKEEAERIMHENNEEWYQYCQQCYDLGITPADNEVMMFEEE